MDFDHVAVVVAYLSCALGAPSVGRPSFAMYDSCVYFVLHLQAWFWNCAWVQIALTLVTDSLACKTFHGPTHN